MQGPNKLAYVSWLI